MEEPDVWRCSRCGWEYPNKHPNAKHRRNHKKKCAKSVTAAEAAGATAGAGVATVAPGGSSSDDALSDDDQQEEQGHVAVASSNGNMAAPHSGNTHIEAAETATGGGGERDRRTEGDSQANLGVLEAGGEGKTVHHQNGVDEITEDGHVVASAVNDDPAELARPELREPGLVANEAVEQTALPASKLPEDKGEPAQDSQEVGELWELLLEGQEHVSTASSKGAPHSADPPGTVTVGEGTAEREDKIVVEREQTAFPSAAAEEQSSAVASKLLEDKGRDAAKEQSLENQEVRELWEQLLEADLEMKNNVNNQIRAAPVAPVAARPEAQQIQPGYLQQSDGLVPGPASLDGGSEANGTNPFLGDGGKQQPHNSKDTWKAFPTDDDDNNGSFAVVNPFVGSEGFRASKVDESDIKPHVALHALFKNDAKPVEGNDLAPLVDEESEAWVKSSKNSSSKKPRSRWSSFICCGSQR